MKKALVLGVLAFFAINIATVQSVNAQDKRGAQNPKAVTTQTTQKGKDVSKNVKKEVKTEKPTAAPTAAPTQTVKEKENKACCKEEKKECKQEAKKAAAGKEPGFQVAPAKEKTPEVGVPPTPKKTKAATVKEAKANTGSGDAK